jgi:hypothetical protein
MAAGLESCGGTHKPEMGMILRPSYSQWLFRRGGVDANARMPLGLKDFVTVNNLAHFLFTLVQ